MKTSMIASISLLGMGLCWSVLAKADTTEATCVVRKDGDKQKGKSGPCSFSQRQGFIDIDLKNGDTVSLSPGSSGGHFKDQHGNKVTRSSAGSNGMTLKWENGRHIEITWMNNSGYGSASSSSYGNGGNHSPEYQRGYNDGMRGNWDQDKHNQDYKDGYAAGESGGKHGNQYNKQSNSGLSHGDYGINKLGNGQFEVVWSKPYCLVTIAADGGISQTTQECTDQQIDRSREIGRRGH